MEFSVEIRGLVDRAGAMYRHPTNLITDCSKYRLMCRELGKRECHGI